MESAHVHTAAESRPVNASAARVFEPQAMKLVKHAVLLSFAIAVLLAAAYVARHALLLIYMSCIFAVVLSPAVDWICKLKIANRHPRRGLAIVLILVGTIAALTLLSFFALPSIVGQLKDFVSQLPDLLDKLRGRFRLGSVPDNLNVRSFSIYLAAHMTAVTAFFGTLANTIASTAAVLILTAYLTLDGEKTLRWFMSLFPPERADRLETTLHRAGVRMRRWLTGQLMLMLILGFASAITFGLMQIRFFYLLALFAGVANFIPFLGPLATVVLAGSVAAVDSLWKTLGVLIFYAAYQQVESAFLTPRIMQAQVQLSPSAVLIALLIGSEIAGILGALIAVPSAVLVSVLISEYLVQRPASNSSAFEAKA
jgi:predicted PurR-regulated permease PerM